MTESEFIEYRQESIEILEERNEACWREYELDQWSEREYDLEAGTLVFSEDDQPKVVARIQVVGRTSGSAWQWGWAIDDMPKGVIRKLDALRRFGDQHDVADLLLRELPEDETIGWELTAVALRVLGAKGAYRYPTATGCLYLLFTELENADGRSRMWCAEHGSAFSTFLCSHLLFQPSQKWYSAEPDEEQPWPDAWCSECNEVFEREGGWSEENSELVPIRLTCHHCYERARREESR